MIAFGGLAFWAGTHAYVEAVELGGSLPLLSQDEAFYALAEDDAELCFSGGHVGGGTDPRLPFSVRNAARAAYIAQHYGSRAAGLQDTNATVKTVDLGILEAERYLLFSLSEAKKHGFQLPDPAIVELESRLAGIRERLGGATGLLAAGTSFQRIFDSLQKRPVDDDWARRESARAARKVGEVSLRMATEELQGDAASQELQVAEKWLLRAAKTALRVPEEAIVVKPAAQNSKGWFGLSSSKPSLGTRPIDSILVTLQSQPFLLPVDARSLFITLTSLTALYARTSMPTAVSLLNTALTLTPPKPAMSEDLGSKTHDSYISARHALLQAFLGEIMLASQPTSDPRLGLLKGSQIARDTSIELHKTGLIKERSMMKAIWTATFGSAEDKAAERLRHRVCITDRDARTAASTTYYLLGIIHERASRQKEALEAYTTAMRLAKDIGDMDDLSKPLDDRSDHAGFARALGAHTRLKESM